MGKMSYCFKGKEHPGTLHQSSRCYSCQPNKDQESCQW